MKSRTRAAAHAPALAPADVQRRLTYVMLFRVAVMTLLLGATFAVELASPGLDGTSPLGVSLLKVIGTTYALTIAYAIWLSRSERLMRLAALQLGGDLIVTTYLVHLTGGADSSFVFVYLLIIVGASLFH